MKTLNLACCIGCGLIGSLVLLHWKDHRHSVHEVPAVPLPLPTETAAAIIKPERSLPPTLLTSKKTVRIRARELKASRASAGILQPTVIRFHDHTPQKPHPQTLVRKIDEHKNAFARISNRSRPPGAVDAATHGHHRLEQELARNDHDAAESFGAASAAERSDASTTETSIVHEAVYRPTAANSPVAKRRSSYIPSYAATTRTETGTETYSYMMLYEKAEKLKEYARKKGYDTSYAFLTNLGMKSGRKRFFVMDLGSMTIVKTGIVAHGRGHSQFAFNKRYSNKRGSNCSSLGIFKVGRYYKGGFGASYRLHGLQKTNNNAYGRSIVLHAMNCVPYEENDYPVCQSEGCPSLSPQFFREIRPIIDSRHRPMLMYVYDPTTEKE